MKKTWRPDGWITEVCHNSPAFPHQGRSRYDCHHGELIVDLDSFEQGADAMLEALRKQGRHFEHIRPDNPRVIQFCFGRGRGTLVFIPDEEEQCLN